MELWPREAKEFALELWNQDKSAKFIAGELSHLYERQFSRNSVMGVLNRLGAVGKKPRKTLPPPKAATQHPDDSPDIEYQECHPVAV